MILLPIKRNIWDVLAVCDNKGNCELLDFFNDLDSNYNSSMEKLLAIISQISDDNFGPRLLPDDVSHYVHKEEKIFEFIAGDLRLLWFYSTAIRKVIICSHCFVKDSKRTPPLQIKKAIKAKKQYDTDVKSGAISVLDDDGGTDT